VALGLDATAEQAAQVRPELGADIDRLRREVEEAIEDVRRLVRGLRPPRLDDAGFEAALEELAVRSSRSGLRVRVRRVGALPAIDTAVETAAYRIAAEAVTNVARHARARTCEVTVAEHGGRLRLAVADDGEGLPPGATLTGTGRASMRERAEELGGTLHVGAGPDGGCLVEADLPLRVTP
jgi:signal transduction histidine kinase